MANFKVSLPDELINEIKGIEQNTDKIIGEMTRAGAEVVLKNMQANAPPIIAPAVKMSKTYKTPTDGGINTKVYISGYAPFKGGRTSFIRKGAGGDTYSTNKGVPLDFLAKIYEYGRSDRPFPKRPFVRKSFNKSEIESAMLEAQKRLSGGLLDE